MGRTATGTQTNVGTVAVDPQVIPLGKKMWIPHYGRGRALDTGPDVRGNHIDIWLPSCDAARQWGVKHLKIRIK